MNDDTELVGLATVPPAPDMMLHDAVPINGTLAAMAVVDPQSVWSGPALAAVGFAVIVICTSSVEAAQGALETVQRKV